MGRREVQVGGANGNVNCKNFFNFSLSDMLIYFI